MWTKAKGRQCIKSLVQNKIIRTTDRKVSIFSLYTNKNNSSVLECRCWARFLMRQRRVSCEFPAPYTLYMWYFSFSFSAKSSSLADRWIKCFSCLTVVLTSTNTSRVLLYSLGKISLKSYGWPLSPFSLGQVISRGPSPLSRQRLRKE